MLLNRKMSVGFVTGFIIAIATLTAAPRSMESRFASLRGDGLRIPELYNRIETDPRPIDVAFLGSSRTVAAVDDLGLELALRNIGISAHVANLGMWVVGRDFQLLLAQKLFEYKRPRLVVLEINEHETPYGHPYLPYVGRASDLLIAGVPWNFMQLYLLFLKEQLIGLIDTVLPGSTSVPPVVHLAYGWQPYGSWSKKTNGAASIGDRIEAWLGPQARRLADRAMAGYGDGAVANIVADAHAHGASVIFLYLAEYKYAANPAPELIRQYEQWGNVIVVPRDIAQDQSNWFEEPHMNSLGARRLTPFLSTAVADALGPQH